MALLVGMECDDVIKYFCTVRASGPDGSAAVRPDRWTNRRRHLLVVGRKATFHCQTPSDESCAASQLGHGTGIPVTLTRYVIARQALEAISLALLKSCRAQAKWSKDSRPYSPRAYTVSDRCWGRVHGLCTRLGRVLLYPNSKC